MGRLFPQGQSLQVHGPTLAADPRVAASYIRMEEMESLEDRIRMVSQTIQATAAGCAAVLKSKKQIVLTTKTLNGFRTSIGKVPT